MLKSKFALVYAFILALMLMYSSVAKAQTAIEYKDNSFLVSFDADVCTTATASSEWFSVSDYISHSLVTYPVWYTKLQSSASSNPHITATIIGSMDMVNEVIVDTIGAQEDSLETLYSGSTNFNNKKFWYYKIKYAGTAVKNTADATIKTYLLFIRPEN